MKRGTYQHQHVLKMPIDDSTMTKTMLKPTTVSLAMVKYHAVLPQNIRDMPHVATGLSSSPVVNPITHSVRQPRPIVGVNQMMTNADRAATRMGVADNASRYTGGRSPFPPVASNLFLGR